MTSVIYPVTTMTSHITSVIYPKTDVTFPITLWGDPGGLEEAEGLDLAQNLREANFWGFSLLFLCK